MVGAPQPVAAVLSLAPAEGRASLVFDLGFPAPAGHTFLLRGPSPAPGLLNEWWCGGAVPSCCLAFIGSESRMQLPLVRHGPPSPTEATAAGQSPPLHPDGSFLEGEGGGHTPGCGLGKAGACRRCPLPRCVQLVGSELQGAWPRAPRGADRMFMPLEGSSGGGVLGPHPSPVLPQAQAGAGGTLPRGLWASRRVALLRQGWWAGRLSGEP